MKTVKIILVFLVVVFVSCVKDKPNKTVPTTVNLSTGKKVFIINEGNFMNANASVSLYDTGNETVVENYFYAQNNSALGDVAQSINKINNDYYIVVNNSGKIVVCNEYFVVRRNISGLTSPRYIIQVSNQKAYVSDLYANAISIIDLNNGTKTGSIPCGGWTEKMVMLYNKVYVTNMQRNYLYVINTTNNTLTDSIYLGYKTGEIVLDKNDQIWVMGNYTANPAIEVKLTRINPLDTTDRTTLAYSSPYPASALCINRTKDTLYYLNNGVNKQAISSVLLPTKIVNAGTKNFYGLGIHPTTGDIYVSDALDFIQKANIYIYNSHTGEQKKIFNAGINANGFYFD